MEAALLYDRLQFAFTITFHYLFPQLTMGLALLIVYFKTRAFWTILMMRPGFGLRFLP